MTLEAESISVNLTRRSWDSWIQSPNDPDEMMLGGFKSIDYREFLLEDGRFRATPFYYQANLLVEALSNNADATLVLDTASRWAPGEGDAWWAGYYFPGHVVQEDPLTHFTPSPRDGTYGVSSGVRQIEVHGDFRLYSWGANLTVEGMDHSPENVLTGIWTEDVVTLPTGQVAQRRSHAQLLRLDATNATLRLSLGQGETRWAAPDADVSSAHLDFSGAVVDLASLHYAYNASIDALALSGEIQAHLGSNATDALRATIEARNATVDLRPTSSQALPPETPYEAEPAVGSGADAAGPSVAPRGSESVPYWIGAATLAGSSAFVFVARRLRSRKEADRLVVLAEQSLLRGRAAEGEHYASQALQIEPRNGRALFLAGASLLKQGQNDRAARLLEEVLARFEQEVAGLAYLLSLSLHRAGRVNEAKRWLGLVARDPHLWESLGQETDFDLVLKRFIGVSRPDAAYA